MTKLLDKPAELTPDDLTLVSGGRGPVNIVDIGNNSGSGVNVSRNIISVGNLGGADAVNYSVNYISAGNNNS